MLNSILIKLKTFYLLFICSFSFISQNSLAHLSDLDQWNYIKSLIEDRIKLSRNLILELETEIDNEESLNEKYHLIASLTGQNDSLIQGLIQKSGLSSNTPESLGLLSMIIYELKIFDLVPWVHFPERMVEGNGSFCEPFMQEKLLELNQALSEPELPASSELVDPAMVMTLYLRVNHQISLMHEDKKKFTNSRDKIRDKKSSNLLKILELLEEEIFQNNFNFLNTLREQFFKLLDTSQKRYISNLKRSELMDESAFISVLKEDSDNFEKFKIINKNLRNELFSLYEKAKSRLGKLPHYKEGEKDPKEFLRIELSESETISNDHYFEKLFLPILKRQFECFDDSISQIFRKLEDELKEFIENYTLQMRLHNKSLKLFETLLTHQLVLQKRIDEIINPDDPHSADGFQKIAMNRIIQEDLADFDTYVRARAMSFLMALSDRLGNFEKEVDAFFPQIRKLKSTIKNSKSPSRSPELPMKGKSKSSLELKEEVNSPVVLKEPKLHLSVDDVEHVPMNEGHIAVHLEDPSIITEDLNSQDREALESEFAQLTGISTEIEGLERGASIFVQTTEDKYTHDIQKQIKGKDRKVLEDLYFSNAKIRFGTLQSLIKRCGGMLRFDGGGSSHFHITLPGGRTGRSWRLHGEAHSSKIQRRALEGFRDAFRGVAEILGIEHAPRR